jgi:hypothetical protein
MISVDEDTYQKILKNVGSLSSLFTDAASPYLSSKFVEKLYAYAAEGVDLSSRDMSFDVRLNSGVGVGVKTFVATSLSASRSEKIAEFSAVAAIGEFEGLSPLNLAIKVSVLRNSRVSSDANIYEIDLSKSIYHCLVRTPTGCFIHEESYSLIDTKNLQIVPPTNSGRSRHIKFTDGESTYIFNISKNTLYKKFILNSGLNGELMEISVVEDIFEKMLNEHAILATVSSSEKSVEVEEHLAKVQMSDLYQDSIVLPLYSTRDRTVPKKSGINQWNASGRDRKFGEAYIPIPAEVRRKHKGFLPSRDVPFQLRMPNGEILEARVCQDDGKALMSSPNSALCEWLFKLIDQSQWKSRQRMISHQPYTYEDLVNIGQDSVLIAKVPDSKGVYELIPLPLGSFEDFIANESI